MSQTFVKSFPAESILNLKKSFNSSFCRNYQDKAQPLGTVKLWLSEQTGWQTQELKLFQRRFEEIESTAQYAFSFLPTSSQLPSEH